MPPPVSAQSGYEVKGFVLDQVGPIVGATVVEQGTSNGTSTGLDGEYKFSVSGAEAIVEISCIGYKTQTFKASQVPQRLTLDEDALFLDDVVVIGYGTVKKEDMTGSIVAIKSDELSRGAVVSTQDMLKGKVPGLHIIPGDGGPGSGSTIRIRGAASLNASNNPLIVIDGVPIADNGGQGMSNPLDMLNPNDIDSFTVLKDASSAAIYGSRVVERYFREVEVASSSLVIPSDVKPDNCWQQHLSGFYFTVLLSAPHVPGSLRMTECLVKHRLFLFQGEQPALPVQEAVFTASCSPYLSRLLIQNLIGQFQRHTVILFDSRYDLHHIAEMHHGSIGTVYLQNRTDDPLPLHFRIVHPDLIHIPDSCGFKPSDIVGMMNDAHLICLIVLRLMLVSLHVPPHTAGQRRTLAASSARICIALRLADFAVICPAVSLPVRPADSPTSWQRTQC